MPEALEALLMRMFAKVPRSARTALEVHSELAAARRAQVVSAPPATAPRVCREARAHPLVEAAGDPPRAAARVEHPAPPTAGLPVAQEDGRPAAVREGRKLQEAAAEARAVPAPAAP